MIFLFGNACACSMVKIDVTRMGALSVEALAAYIKHGHGLKMLVIVVCIQSPNPHPPPHTSLSFAHTSFRLSRIPASKTQNNILQVDSYTLNKHGELWHGVNNDSLPPFTKRVPGSHTVQRVKHLLVGWNRFSFGGEFEPTYPLVTLNTLNRTTFVTFFHGKLTSSHHPHPCVT